MKKRFKFHSTVDQVQSHVDEVERQTRDHDDLPEQVTAAEINQKNRDYWGDPGDAERPPISEQALRVGTLAGVIPAKSVDVTLMHGGREYFFDAQTPRGQRVLSLPSDRFVVEQSDGSYHIYDFGAAADPDADPVTQAIAKFESELSQEGETLKGPHHPGTTDQGDVARNLGMQRILNSHDWSKHGR